MKLRQCFSITFFILLGIGGIGLTQSRAQEKGKAAKQEKVRVQMLKEANGEFQKLDTLLLLESGKQVPLVRFEKFLHRDSAKKNQLFNGEMPIVTWSRDSTSARAHKFLREGPLLSSFKHLIDDSTKARTVKLKVLQKIEDTFYALDTTLVIPPGISQREAVKKLNLEKADLVKLGAKPLQTVNGETGKVGIFSLSPSTKGDSTRTQVFRTITADSLVGKSTHIFLRGGVPLKIREGIALRSARVAGDTQVFKRTIYVDSLLKERVMYRMDTTFHLKPDTIRVSEVIRTLRDSANSQVRAIRILKSTGDEKQEPRSFRILQGLEGEIHQIIVLKPSKETAKEKSDAKKKAKKEKAKPAKLAVQVYPNPSSGEVNLSFQVPQKANTKVQVVNSQGRVVFIDDAGIIAGAYSKDIDLSKFGPGIYIIQILSGTASHAEKVVVR